MGGPDFNSTGLFRLFENFLDFYTTYLESGSEVALTILIIAIFITFFGIHLKRVSMSLIAYSWVFYGSKKLEEQIVLAMEARKNKEEIYYRVLSYISAIMRKMNTDLFFMVFMSIVVGIICLWIMKIVVCILVAILVYCIFEAYNTSSSTEKGETAYTALQLLMLCMGVLGIVLAEKTASIAYFILFAAYGSLFLILDINVVFKLGFDVTEAFSSFFHNGFNKILDNRVVVAYLFLTAAGLFYQLILGGKNDTKRSTLR